ncbi:MAG: hypothetical protein NVS1B14_01390 [Vulcanimicrobiaceae bacterium]
MSNRQDRRRQARSVTTAATRRRDPMTALYMGFVIAIVFVFAALGLFKFKQNHDYAVATATASPGPNATASALPLADMGKDIGKNAFPPGDEKGGGFGAPVDGIKCETSEQVALHIHAHVALFVKGRQIAIPRFIGLVPGSPGCLYWLHSHDATGIIHVEAPELRDYTLGDFFHVWGEDLSRDRVGPYSGSVSAFVNGSAYAGDLARIPLTAHNQITLEVGKPIVPPPNYQFPQGD